MKRLFSLWVGLLIVVLASAASAPDITAAPAPPQAGQVQFIEFYSPT